MQTLTDRSGQHIERVEVSLNDLRYWTYMEPACKDANALRFNLAKKRRCPLSYRFTLGQTKERISAGKSQARL